jgi:hypothetical protein
LNALKEEACISEILLHEGGIVPLKPENPIPTHPKVSAPVDHILVFPGDRRIEYTCQVLDDKISCCASDHLPVVAIVSVYPRGTDRYQQYGPGVVPIG